MQKPTRSASRYVWGGPSCGNPRTNSSDRLMVERTGIGVVLSVAGPAMAPDFYTTPTRQNLNRWASVVNGNMDHNARKIKASGTFYRSLAVLNGGPHSPLAG